MKPKAAPLKPRTGRIERALDVELRGSGAGDIGAGARAHLRGLARAMDVAERTEDLDASAKVGRVYLEARRAYGLAGGEGPALDPFAAFVAGLSAPSLGDPTDP
jgi:hypothetical protein